MVIMSSIRKVVTHMNSVNLWFWLMAWDWSLDLAYGQRGTVPSQPSLSGLILTSTIVCCIRRVGPLSLDAPVAWCSIAKPIQLLLPEGACPRFWIRDVLMHIVDCTFWPPKGRNLATVEMCCIYTVQLVPVAKQQFYVTGCGSRVGRAPAARAEVRELEFLSSQTNDTSQIDTSHYWAWFLTLIG